MIRPIRGQADRRRDGLGSHSPVQRSQNSSLQPHYLNEPRSPVARASQYAVEVNSPAADRPWPSVAMQFTTPSRSLSRALSGSALNVSPTPPATLSWPFSQLAINNTSNVNNNAQGGTIVNNNSVFNNFAQSISRDQDAEDLTTIVKGLGQHHVARALYDAQPLAGGCMKGTRVQVLDDTEDLLTSHGGPHIVWIAGMAGTGKTAIALTLSRRLVKLPMVLLGGTFFCSRSAGAIERTDSQRIIPTLATVLARQLPAYARALAAELRKDPDLASKKVDVQVELLLLKPLKSVRKPDKQIVLVIDALDECHNQVLLAELINSLADFEATPLDNPGNRKRLVELIEVLEDFKRTQLDSLTRLAELIGPLVDLRAALQDDCAAHPRFEELINSLADFSPTMLNGRDDQAELSELIVRLAVFKTTPPNHPSNLAKLMKFIDSLAEFKALRLDDRVTLAELIGELADCKSTPVDNCDSRTKLEALIDAIDDFKATGLKDLVHQVELAKLIDELADFRSTPPVKFLLTSRPEMHIRDTAITDRSLSSILQLHMVDQNVVTSDIRLYIQRTLESSSKSFTWYTDRDIEDLAALSAGLFIFASTVLAYILRRKDAPGRSERLRTIKLQAAESALATDPLDKMYSLVLMQASDPSAYEAAELDETRRIVAVILSTRSPFTIKALAELLGVSTEHLRGALNELHAVVFVPEQDEKGELRALHASFGDYIFARAPAHIRIDKSLGHDELARACLQRMAADDLCFNISRSRSSYEANPKTQPGWIERSLFYACLNWTHHIDLASGSSSFDDIIVTVLRVKLLFWLEVLSITGQVDRAAKFFRLAAEKVTSPYLSQFFRDADSFVTSSREAIQHSAPHIYISAMAFAPKDSLIYLLFSSYLIGIPEVEIFGVHKSLGDCRISAQNVRGTTSPNQPMLGHTGKVHAVAVSCDGYLIASASADGSARVWDVRTCQQMYPPLLGHEGPVCAVAFSLDGRWIATGSDDKTSRLWNAQTGQFTTIELRGHTGLVTAIAFAPNGLHLASGSWDKTVRVWDVSTRQPAEILRIKSVDSVSSVAYSPNGAVIAVGCKYGWIQTLDAATGQKTQSIHHSIYGGPTSLAFSPDGARLVAASFIDINVFDVQTDQRVAKLLGIESKSAVTAVAYSPDGRFIACGIKGYNVLLWRLDGKNAVKLLLSGHVNDITSVKFSSDGRFLITGSWDSTIRILDLEKIRSLADGSTQSHLAALALARYEPVSDQNSGWLVSPSHQRLLWVPPKYGDHLEISSHSRIIATHRVVLTAKAHVLFQGEDWIKCWRPSS